jgi:excinuclease UvrABC nuclease subunit
MSLASINRKIEALTAEMLKAAEAEDFETAARLRNQIAALKGDSEGSPLARWDSARTFPWPRVRATGARPANPTL